MALGASATLALADGVPPGTFVPAFQPYEVALPLGVRAVDHDRDGRIDVVVIQRTGASLLRCHEEGTLGPAEEILRESQVSTYTTGDLDHDGVLDLVLVSQGRIVVAMGTAGGFRRAEEYAADAPRQVHLADFDGDGHLDLFATEPARNRIQVRRGDGRGSFGAPSWFTSGGAGPVAVVTGDLDGDGHLDVVVSNAMEPGFFVHLGNGDGTWSSPDGIPASGAVRVLAVAELNGDDHLDVVIRGAGVQIYPGLGDGRFAPPVTALPGAYSASVSLVDFDRDGRLDVAAATDSVLHSRLMLARRDSTGAWRSTSWIAPPSCSAFDFADLDADGDLEAITASIDADYVSVHAGAARGRLVRPHAHRVAMNADDVLARDLNGDGRTDLVVNEGGTLRVLMQDTRGDLRVRGSPMSGDYARLALGDLEGDGIPDLVGSRGLFHSPFTVGVVTRRGRGDGTFLPESVHRASNGFGLAVADFDRDGADDVIAGGSRLSVLWSGSDTLSPVAPDPYVPEPADWIGVGDVTRDGVRDFMAASDRMLIMFQGGGADRRFGRLANPVYFRFGDFLVGDVNGDSGTDVITSGDSSVFVFLADYAAFATPVARRVSWPAQNMVVADVDVDGCDDVILAHARAGLITILHGAREGGTGRRTVLGVDASQEDGLAVADMNQDGALDIVLGDGFVLRSAGKPIEVQIEQVESRVDDVIAHLSWRTSGATDFQLERKHGDGLWTKIARLEPDASGMVVFQDFLAANVLACYRLGAVGFEEGGPSTVSCLQRTFIPPPPPPPAFTPGIVSISPNPAARALTVTLGITGDSPARLELVDLSGRIRVRDPLPRELAGQYVRTLRLDGVTPGVYWVRLLESGRIWTRRAVVCR